MLNVSDLKDRVMQLSSVHELQDLRSATMANSNKSDEAHSQFRIPEEWFLPNLRSPNCNMVVALRPFGRKSDAVANGEDAAQGNIEGYDIVACSKDLESGEMARHDRIWWTKKFALLSAMLKRHSIVARFDLQACDYEEIEKHLHKCSLTMSDVCYEMADFAKDREENNNNIALPATKRRRLDETLPTDDTNRTVVKDNGIDKERDIETYRAEIKALPQSEAEATWRRYEEPMASQRSTSRAKSHEDAAEPSASSTGDVQRNSSAVAKSHAAKRAQSKATPKTQRVKAASVEHEDSSPGAHAYPKKANGLYDFESMKLSQLRSLVTVFKDHGATHGSNKDAMIAHFESLPEEIVEKVMRQKESDDETARLSLPKEIAKKSRTQLQALTKMSHSVHPGRKTKRELLADILEIERNKAENPIMKAFSKVARCGVPEDPSSQGARTSQELPSNVRPRIPKLRNLFSSLESLFSESSAKKLTMEIS